MCTLQISQNVLPDSFVNEIVPNPNNKSETTIIRSNIKNMEEIERWIKEFGAKSCTRWNVRSSNPHGVKIVCSKKFVCHHASFMKVKEADNKRGNSKNAACLAAVLIQVKKNSPKTRYTDSYVKRGLCGVISVENRHTHTLKTEETLRFLPANDEMRSKFFKYFDDGMGIAESHKYHQRTLDLNNYDINVARGDINPSLRRIRYWHDQWRSRHSGLRADEGLIEKIKNQMMQPLQAGFQRLRPEPSVFKDNCQAQLHQRQGLEEKQDIYSKEDTTLYVENPFEIVIVTPSVLPVTTSNSPVTTAGVESGDIADSQESVDSDFQMIIKALLDKHKKYGSSLSHIGKLNDRLKGITTKAKWETFLCRAGNNISLRRRDRAMVRVRPSAVARRKLHINRGSKPAAGEAVSKKRK